MRQKVEFTKHELIDILAEYLRSLNTNVLCDIVREHMCACTKHNEDKMTCAIDPLWLERIRLGIRQRRDGEFLAELNKYDPVVDAGILSEVPFSRRK